MEALKNGKKVILLVAYLVIAWIIFSMRGFLPDIYSFPVPEEKQKSRGAVLVSDNNFYSRLLQIQRKTVAPGTFSSYSFFNNNNFDKIDYDDFADNVIVTGGMYDKEKNMYYFGSGNYISEASVEKMNFDEMKEKDKNSRFDTLMRYQDLWIEAIYGGVVINGRYKYQVRGVGYVEKYTKTFYGNKNGENWEEYQFGKIYEMLEKSEKEKTSLFDFSQLLSLVHNSAILGWYPEDHIAVMTDTRDNQRYFYKVTSANKEEPAKFGPFEIENIDYYRYSQDSVLVNNQNEKKLYILNFENGERRDICVTPNMKYVRYQIKDNGKVLVIAVTDNDKVWAYDEELNASKEYDVKTQQYNALVLGEDSFLFVSSPKDSSFTNGWCIKLDILEKEEQ